jgi:hypothetical protein
MSEEFSKIRQKALADAFKALMDFKLEPDQPTDEDITKEEDKLQ